MPGIKAATAFFAIVLSFVGVANAQSNPPCPRTTNLLASFSAQSPVLDVKAASKMNPFVVKGRSAADEPSTVWVQATAQSSASSYLCTGTLIGANRILTAAHCICAACRMSVGFGPNMKSQSGKILADVVAIALHPSYRRAGPSMQPGYDLAVLSIQNYASCPQYKKPVLIYPAAMVLKTNDFLVVGYGQTELKTQSGLPLFGKKRKAKVVMGSRTCTQSWARRAGCVPFREFVLKSSVETVIGNELGADTCNGDSGGPAYVVGAGNTRLLAGVTSRALVPKGGFNNEGCGFGGIYEYVGTPQVLRWLRSIVPDLQVALN